MKTLKAIQGTVTGLTWMRSLVTGLVVLAWCVILSATAAPAPDTFVLKQKCTAVGGAYTVYLSKNSLRIENPRLILFAQAPKWAITVLNPKKKIYFQSDYKSCLKHIEQARAPFSTINESSSVKWRKAQGEVIAGLTTEQWCDDTPGSRDKHSVKCWTLPDPQFAPQCAELMATCYGIPSIGHGIPLRFFGSGSANSLLPMPQRHSDDDGHQQHEYLWLDTSSIKKTPPSPALFAIPSGFKPTKAYVDIAVDGDAHNVDTDFILKDLRKHPEALFNSR